MKRNKLYAILMIACGAGYIWLFWAATNAHSKHQLPDVCLIKCTTSLPCPSCGSTRSVLSLLHGDFLNALYLNPFGIIIALIMVAAPLWVLFDISTRKKTLLNFYALSETQLKKPGFAIGLCLLVLVNWVWNITKAL